MQKPEPKKNWTITSSAFSRLLNWLSEGKSSEKDSNKNFGNDVEGHNYLQMRERLVSYFDRKNCLMPDELADETLNRVARRLEEAGEIESETPAKYCYIVARFVFMEYLREVNNKPNVPLDDHLRQSPGSQLIARDDEQNKVKEKMLDCLERCADKLDPASREIIMSYYYGTERIKIENRRALAASLNISANALSIRACRIRDKLESCVGKCVGEIGN